MMLLADVRVFLEIAGTGSFTTAAAALRLPKSSVARQMARLEDELGCQLLHRTTRTVALSEAGRLFLPHARRLLDDSIEAAGAVRGTGDSASGLLVVSAPGTFGRMFLAPLLPAFRKRNPNVRVALRLTSAKVPVGTGAGAADVAIRLGPVLEPDLGVRILGELSFWLVASPGYLKDRRPPESPLDLSQHELIELPTPAFDNRLDLQRHGEVQPVRCVPSIGIDDPDAVRRVALADGGIAALPEFLVRDDAASGRLVRVLEGWAPPPATIQLVYGTRIAPPLRVRAFADFLMETAGRAQPWRTA